ncbi:MAG TPA: hypothetical protein VGN17_23070 [Bryobacteraceae bacterium]
MEEYTGYLESNEGTFIAIARQLAAHPKDSLWWSLWDCGLPVQNTYLPLLQVMVAAFSRVTGHSVALSFHQVTAFFYCAGPMAMYWMAWKMTHRPGPSFLAALTFSLISPCAWLVPATRVDLGGLWNLRRLQNVAYYGEAPLAVSLAFLPLAILFLYWALSRGRLWMKVAAGVAIAATILANAFGAVLVAQAGLCLLVSLRLERAWRNLIVLGTIGAFCYAWISPLLPPSVLAAIRLNSPTVEGDFRYNARSFLGLCLLAAAFSLAAWLARRLASPALRFFLLFTLLSTGIVVLAAVAKIYVVPQPHRYQLAMDMGWAVLIVFGSYHWLGSFGPRATAMAAAILLAGLAFQYRNVLNYAHHEIRSQDMTRTPTYRAALWMRQNMSGERIEVSGASSFHVDDFADVPQVFGGHEPMLPHFVMRDAYYVIHRGEDFGFTSPAISVLWLKALGAQAILVPDQSSAVYYKPFANPRKFDGVLSPLWSDRGNTIYAIPNRSVSLAHVVPDGSLVLHVPVNGVDLAEIREYVKALDDPELPEATLTWTDHHTAAICARVRPGQSLSVQITYNPGWRAEMDGHPQHLEEDGLGFLALKPSCANACVIQLTYDGGPEWRATLWASALSMAVVLGFVVFRRDTLVPSHT